MKSVSYLLIFMLFISISACKSSKQLVTPPNIVSDAFKMKFPEVKSARWSSEDSGRFEADFKMKDKDFSAIFSSTGEWILTEKKILSSELPATVNRTLEDGFGDYNVMRIEEVVTAGNENYFEIKLSNRQEIKYLNLSHDGVILNNEEPEKEDE